MLNKEQINLEEKKKEMRKDACKQISQMDRVIGPWETKIQFKSLDMSKHFKLTFVTEYIPNLGAGRLNDM